MYLHHTRSVIVVLTTVCDLSHQASEHTVHLCLSNFHAMMGTMGSSMVPEERTDKWEAGRLGRTVLYHDELQK
jgi:hypothetical protein